MVAKRRLRSRPSSAHRDRLRTDGRADSLAPLARRPAFADPQVAPGPPRGTCWKGRPQDRGPGEAIKGLR